MSNQNKQKIAIKSTLKITTAEQKKKHKKSVKISRNILEVLTSSTHPQKAYRVA